MVRVTIISLQIPKTAGTAVMKGLYQMFSSDRFNWRGHKRNPEEFYKV